MFWDDRGGGGGPNGQPMGPQVDTANIRTVLSTNHVDSRSFSSGCCAFRRTHTSADPIRLLCIRLALLLPVLSTCPLHTNSGCGKERRILIGPWGSAKAAPVRNYLEVYWPCAGGLSAVNAIGTQLRDPINSGLTRWRMAVS